MKVKNKLLNLDMVIYQDSDWFKFSLDSVLLANFVTINCRVKKIMDFATGNAPVPMLLSYRTKAQIYGIEYQKCVYELAIQSVRENCLDNQVHLICGDVSNIQNDFSSDSFDVVTCNPPYFKSLDFSYFNQNFVKSVARHEIFLDLDTVLKQAFYLLKTGGIFAMVHRTERFSEIIEKMKKYHLEPKRIQFIYPKEGKNSDLFLIEAVKNGNVGLKMLFPLIIHESDNTYTDEVSRILEFKY